MLALCPSACLNMTSLCAGWSRKASADVSKWLQCDVISPVIRQACGGWHCHCRSAGRSRADGSPALVLSCTGMVWLLVRARGQVCVLVPDKMACFIIGISP